jgi:Xaa-Pro aminopeptidase
VVVVDCGARLEHYCSDITRTYPVTGVFSKKQQEVYDAVLECQKKLIKLVKPGMYLHNKDKPELSLYHHMSEFFAQYGYKEFIVHGVGHFLGLEVHDVGSADQPLQEGDVITIEPGLYLPKEGFGVRIEDDYWVTKDSVRCLTNELPKEPADLQKIIAESGRIDR